MRRIGTMIPFNIHSYHGEDGIIEWILKIIRNPNQPGWRHAVEFGAWDGKFHSNTRYLLEKKKFTVLYIEGDAEKYAQLVQNCAAYGKRAVCVNAWVGLENNRLDSILEAHKWKNDFQLLSIDIDGMDYWVWKSLENYRPRVVVIEFNSTVPTDVFWVQEKNFKLNQGCSLRALQWLGESKGYTLIHANINNAFFIRNDHAHKFDVPDNLEDIWLSRHRITYVWTGYDGTVFSNEQRMIGHNIFFDQSKMQMIPRILRGFERDQGRVKRFFYLAWRKLFHSKHAKRRKGAWS